jgi:hypothetical protein
LILLSRIIFMKLMLKKILASLHFSLEMWLLQLTLNKPVGCIFSNNDIKKDHRRIPNRKHKNCRIFQNHVMM